MQTVIGVSVAKFTGINPLLGVLAGSVSMSGGHGAAGAFGQTVESLGVTGSLTMALSSATFGLGATTNAMINMGEVSGRYGYTVNPYLIIPLTGAFLIDIFQMPIIITAINLFK